ncbi:MAG: MBL fold metallo-hydrolase [Candidatus Sungbacteria bacterium]|nr:MBL fold metallo-hydrolase [Candidatus Sungbacteria bacterium]
MKILIDCGLVQGGRFCESRNAEPFGFDPKSIDALFVTHGHLDHVGRIPRLVREGFSGVIYSTPPTRDLSELMLLDGQGLMAKEAEQCGDEVIYAVEDITTAMSLWKPLEYKERVSLDGVTVEFLRAGHILGSAMVRVVIGGKVILFSGDLGSKESLLLPPAEDVDRVDYLIMESTYGDRTHEDLPHARMELERAIEDVAARGGTLMIPSFATERTQDIIFLLNEMLVLRQVPEMPIFIDSPLATKVTAVFEKYRSYYKPEIQELYKNHPHLFESKTLKNTTSVEESKAINDVPPPKVVVAGSGMMTGGRILHHMRRYLSRRDSTLLIAGFQAKGSLGRQILEGADTVKIYGESIAVQAKVQQIHGFSAHADRDRLYEFVSGLKDSLLRVFAVQGETEAALSLVQVVRDRLGIAADAPILGMRVELREDEGSV